MVFMLELVDVDVDVDVDVESTLDASTHKDDDDEDDDDTTRKETNRRRRRIACGGDESVRSLVLVSHQHRDQRQAIIICMGVFEWMCGMNDG